MARVEVKALVANVESVQRSPELRALIVEHEPDVVVVQQAYRAREFLTDLAKAEGYRLRQYRPQRSAEWEGVALLVRRGVRVRRSRPLVMRRHWTGPIAGKRHTPRVYPSVLLTKAGSAFRVVGVHLPTANEDEAQQESRDALVEFFADHRVEPTIAAGDFNMSEREMGPLALRCRAKLLASGKVDHGLVSPSNLSAWSRRVPTPEGAHGWTIYTFEVPA